MAENKRYYWIKVSGGFFRDKLIKKLRQIAGGDTFVICYLKMLVLAAETDGKLFYEGLEDDFASELALDIDEDVENVSVTVAYLLRHGILVANDNSEYEMVNIREFVGSETDSARRMRKHRLLHPSDGSASPSDVLVSQNDPNKRETEIKREIERTDLEEGNNPELEGEGEFLERGMGKTSLTDGVKPNRFLQQLIDSGIVQG